MSDSESQKVLEDYFNSLLNEDVSEASEGLIKKENVLEGKALEETSSSESLDQASESYQEEQVLHAGERKPRKSSRDEKQPTVSNETIKKETTQKETTKKISFPDNVTHLHEHVSNQSPVLKEASPEIKETSPEIKEAPPVTKEASPVVEEASPIAEETSPVVEESSTVGKESSTVSKESSPASEESSTILEESDPNSPVVKSNDSTKNVAESEAPEEIINERAESISEKTVQRVSPVDPLPEKIEQKEPELKDTPKEKAPDSSGETSAPIKSSEPSSTATPAQTKYVRPTVPEVSAPSESPKPKTQTQTHTQKQEQTHTDFNTQSELEAEKRKQLQRMLDAQLPKAETQTETKREITAQEKLEILAEQQKAALFRAKLSAQETADATKKIVEETLRAPVEAPTPAPAPELPSVKEEIPTPNAEPEISTEDPSLTDDHVKMTEDLLAWGDSGKPEWAERPFEVLLFEVSGLSLAVPLVALGQIVSMSEKLTKLQGQSEWFMGILPSPVGDIRTINTAMFVMPERYDPSQVDDFKYVVTIDGLPWGLAVDQVNQPITLNPDDVKWRGERTKRPWLAGTVKSHMCALLDIPQMAHILENMNRE